jgi:AraC family transcriptional regulator of adaptative response/methylated-DNA-[protein]-cysteine methyltransferase
VSPDSKFPPIDVTATAFQWRVWQALTRIPAGETRSYADVARAIGEPKAARAVGHACGSNKLAFIVPCHRVVRADGTPGGWRWGVARKQKQLRSEARANPRN